jgi:hypothetical protein
VVQSLSKNICGVGLAHDTKIIMNFVTVTCSTDFDAMLLQASSLEFVIDNITHIVIIQDSKIELEQWQSSLSPYYTRHTLVLIQNDLILKLTKRNICY